VFDQFKNRDEIKGLRQWIDAEHVEVHMMLTGKVYVKNAGNVVEGLYGYPNNSPSSF